MKTTILLRLFLLFPLIGIAMPDAAFYIEDNNYKIPTTHFVILTVLLLIFLASFAFKHKENHQH